MRLRRILATSILLSTAMISSSCEIFEQVSIKLNTESIQLNVLDSDEKYYQLSVEVLNGEDKSYTFTYISENPGIASVDKNGLVQAKSVGSTKINVSINEYSDIKASCNVTVIRKEGVKITISNKEKEAYPGDVFTLTATVANADSDDSVTWSSSDQSLATVSSNGQVNVLENAEPGKTISITATSNEDNDVSASCLLTIIQPETYKYDYTIMYYLAASTLEYDYSYGSDANQPKLLSMDIKEILKVKYPSNVKVIIETGGTRKWYLESDFLLGATSISSACLQRWEVTPCDTYKATEENAYGVPYRNNFYNKLTLVSSLNYNQLAKQSSFQSFIEWGINDYKAKQTGVVISGHGGGVQGCAYDENYTYGGYPNVLDTHEIASALSQAYLNTDVDKLTWIGYDCCLMGCADIASIMSKYFDYMVASQEVEGGLGWDHDVWLNYIAKDSSISPEELLPKITKSFVEEEELYCTYSQPCSATLSVINLKEFNTFTNAFNAYVSNVGYDYNKYLSAFTSAYHNFGQQIYGLADLGDFLTEMESRSDVSNTDVKTALSKVVISNEYCEYYTSVTPCGLNVFMPHSFVSGYLQVERDTYYKPLSTKFIGWQDMCVSNWNK